MVSSSRSPRGTADIWIRASLCGWVKGWADGKKMCPLGGGPLMSCSLPPPHTDSGQGVEGAVATSDMAASCDLCKESVGALGSPTFWKEREVAQWRFKIAWEAAVGFG